MNLSHMMDIFVHFFLCINWMLQRDFVISKKVCITDVPGAKLSYSTYSSKQNYSEPLNATKTIWCSADSLGLSSMMNDDYYPLLKVTFSKTLKFVAIGTKGSYEVSKDTSYESFTIYSKLANNIYEALKLGNPNSKEVKVFPAIIDSFLQSGRISYYAFDYRVYTTEFAIYFKLKPGQIAVCTRIMLYTEKTPCKLFKTCPVNNGGCQHQCTMKNEIAVCTCFKGFILWRDGFKCIKDYSVYFRVYKEKSTFEKGQTQCLTQGGHLTTFFTSEEYNQFLGELTQSGVDNQYYHIGYADVDLDNSFFKSIDGSYKTIIPNLDRLQAAGSTVVIGKQNRSVIWNAVTDREEYYISCRISKDGSYLFTGYHDVHDDQFSSSAYNTRISLASSLAFGPARSRRGSKMFVKTATGIMFGSYWNPDVNTNKFLRVTLNSENEISGVFVIGMVCSTTFLTFHIEYKEFQSKTVSKTQEMRKRKRSKNIIFMDPFFNATEITLQISDRTICKGYQWDLIGHLTGRGLVNECSKNPCSHNCIDTPEHFFCTCNFQYHLFIDGKTCLPDVPPQISNYQIQTLPYHLHKNLLKPFVKTTKYFVIVPNETTFDEAYNECKKYGGHLFSPHVITEARTVYSLLHLYKNCKYWFLGLKGKSLMNTEWQDGTWVDFTLFCNAVPEIGTEEMVAVIDRTNKYLWTFKPVSTAKACSFCQYKEKDCDLPILNGHWTILENDWTSSGNVLENAKIDHISLKLANGLNFFQTTEPKGFIQVDLHQIFLLHSMKCSSANGDTITAFIQSKKTSLPFNFQIKYSRDLTNFSNVKNEKNSEEFNCGFVPKAVKSTHFSSPIIARFVRISWSYNADKISFTLRIELYGCPAESSNENANNPQCGTKPSMYIPVTSHSYECFYYSCKLEVETCGFDNFYYNSKESLGCSDKNPCASHPCPEGNICLYNSTKAVCYCQQAITGICEKPNDLWILIEKNNFQVGENITFRAIISNPVKGYIYYVNITKDYSCIPEFHEIKLSTKVQLCATISYKPTTGGKFNATIGHTTGGKVISSRPFEFTVAYHDQVTLKCLSSLRVGGASRKLQLAYPYSQGFVRTFQPSIAVSCNDVLRKGENFQITKFKWTFSSFKFDSSDRCYSDADFDSIDVPYLKENKNGQVTVDLKTMSKGIKRVCLHVTGTYIGKNYVQESCGFFNVIVEPLKIVLEHSTTSRKIPANRELIINASASIDPNQNTKSNISFEWLCKMNDTNATCNFVNELWRDFHPLKNYLLKENGSILKIPPYHLLVNKTYMMSVFISKPNVPGSDITINVFVDDFSTPQLKIRCIKNCRQVVLPNVRLELEMECVDCSSHGVLLKTQTWKLSSKKFGIIPFEVWGPMTTTLNSEKKMILTEGALNMSTEYTFKVFGYAEDGSVATSTYKFKTDSPPTGGSCFVTPLSGLALFTYFSVVCDGYKTPYMPLTYKIKIVKENKQDILLYYGNKSTVNFLTLSEGPEKFNFTHNITIIIANKFETSVSASLEVQVLQKNDLNISGLCDVVGKLLSSGNIILERGKEGFLHLAVTIVDMIGKMRNESNEAEKAKTELILLQLMDILDKIDLNETEIREQITNIISDIVDQQDTLSLQMENKTVSTVTHLVSYLVRLSQDGNTTEVKKYASWQFSIMDKIFNLFSLDVKQKGVSLNKSREKLESRANFLTKTYDDIGHSLLIGIPSDSDPPVILRSKQTAMSVKWSKTNIDELFLTANVNSENEIGSSFAMPMGDKFSTVGKKNITGLDIQVQFWLMNPYLFSESAKSVNMPVLTISQRRHGSSEELEFNLTETVDIFISIKSSKILKHGSIHALNVSYDLHQKVVLYSQSLHLSIPVMENKVQILRIITIDTKTKLKISLGRKQGDNKTLRSRNEIEMPVLQQKINILKGHKKDPNLLFLTEANLGENRTNFILDITVKEMLDEDIRTSICPVKIKIQTFNVDCSYWNLTEKEWKKDGCQVGKFTTTEILHCQCRHLSTFSGGIFVAPNVVDPVGDIVLFMTFFENPVVVTVVVGVWLLYFLLLAWAHRADYNDNQKIGITVLDDNSSGKYAYLICVVTGWWKHAGTSSRVFLYLCGKNQQSAREALVDSERELFKSGAENWFLLKTNESLGRIKSVVIWHNNSGPKPSWFLKEVYVKDLQTDEAWHCVFDDWLSVYKGQCTVYAEIPAIEDKKYCKKRYYQFTLTTSQDIRDGHIWISIFYKPPTSSFTHIQRLTCALCLLLCTMLANIMYHGIPTDDPEDQVDYGDFHLSLTEFAIGIQCALMVFPINLLIIKLFTLVEPELNEEHRPGHSTAEQKLKEHEKKSFKLPKKSLYVIYFFTFLISVICSYFVMLYGLKYGYHKSISWIISFFTSFFESLFVLEPVKVLVLALLVTLIFKQTVKYDTGNVMRNRDDEEKEINASDMDKTFTMFDYYIPPASKRMLQGIRKRIMLDMQTFEIFQEITMYFVFVTIVLLMVLGHRDITETYRISQSIEHVFIQDLQRTNDMLYEVTNSEDMWKYLNTTLLINLMSGEYNSISSSVAFLVGRACLRQIRIKKKDHCKIAPLIRDDLKPSQKCLTDFTLASSDTESYNRNWKYNGTNSHEKMWTYRTALDLGTLPIVGKMASYPGGGYIVELPRNTSAAQNVINDLANSAWVDEYTRVVFVEFTVFNPNVYLFSVLIIMFEFSSTGFVFPYHHLYTSNLYHFKNQFETFVAVVEGFFVLFLFSYTYIEIQKFKNQKIKLYFNDAWSYVEITILVLGYSVIGLFINRLIICNHVMNIFRKSNFDTFVSFHVAAVVDFLFTYVTSALVTLTIIKFFKLLRFNARLSMLSETLRNARPHLFSYAFLFFAFTMSFSLFAVLMFGNVVDGYRNISSTLLTLFVFILGKPDFINLEKADVIWGPIFFFSFSVSSQYVLVNYFLILLMDAFHQTRRKIAMTKTDIHIINYLMKKIRLLGFEKNR